MSSATCRRWPPRPAASVIGASGDPRHQCRTCWRYGQSHPEQTAAKWSRRPRVDRLRLGLLSRGAADRRTAHLGRSQCPSLSRNLLLWEARGFPISPSPPSRFSKRIREQIWKSGCPGRLWVRSAQPLSHVTFPFGKVGKCIRGAADRSLRSFGYMPQHSGRIVDEADRQTPRLNRRSCWGWRAKPFCNSCGIMAMPPFLAV